jgi:threonine dehydrogenase-like Zn-dependent dehydrogenase
MEDDTQQQLTHCPILFEKHQHKLDLVVESEVQTLLVQECYVDKEQNANKYDVVINTTGNPNGLTLSMSLCRPMGTLVLKSSCAAGVAGFHSAPIVIDELNVVGSQCGPIVRALELLQDTGSDVPPLNMKKYITKTFSLKDVREALVCAAPKHQILPEHSTREASPSPPRNPIRRPNFRF